MKAQQAAANKITPYLNQIILKQKWEDEQNIHADSVTTAATKKRKNHSQSMASSTEPQSKRLHVTVPKRSKSTSPSRVSQSLFGATSSEPPQTKNTGKRKLNSLTPSV